MASHQEDRKVIIDESDSEEDEANQINDTALQLRNIYDVSFLMVSAPFAKDGITVEQDKQSRELQFKNFVELHPELKKPNEKVKVDVTNVRSYKDMLDKIEGFMMKYGHAVTVSIIFNGNGSLDGLLFQDQLEGTSLEKVVKDVQDIVVDTRNSSFDSLPYQVELIFSQAYAHNHPQPQIDNFKVVCFTSAGGVEVTEVKIEYDELTMDVVDAHHRQLESHVQDQAKTCTQNLSQYEARKAAKDAHLVGADDDKEVEAGLNEK